MSIDTKAIRQWIRTVAPHVVATSDVWDLCDEIDTLTEQNKVRQEALEQISNSEWMKGSAFRVLKQVMKTAQDALAATGEPK